MNWKTQGREFAFILRVRAKERTIFPIGLEARFKEPAYVSKQREALARPPLQHVPPGQKRRPSELVSRKRPSV